MKSLLVSQHYFPPQRGGISVFMEAVARAMGPGRICCLTARAKGNNGELPVAVYRRPRAFAKNRLAHALGFGSAMMEILLRERPRLLQLASVNEAAFGLWAKRWLRIPFVLYAHGNEIMAAMESDYPSHMWALRRADRVLANSHYTAALVESVGVSRDRIDVVHPICDLDFFRPVAPDPKHRRELLGDRVNDRVLLTVGHLVARKGQDMVIKALPEILETVPDVTYLIVGEGPYRRQLESLAEAVGVADRVVFAGVVPTDRLLDTYAQCDAFAMVSRELPEQCEVEGFGIVYLEASACGKPVIGSYSGGVPDAIADGESGLLVDPETPSEIARAAVRILSNPSLGRQLGQQGRERVLREFTLARLGARIEEVLRQISRSGAER